MISKNTKILWYFILLFLAVNILTLKNGHNWGDDFCQYILHAKNIVEHESYQRSFDLDQGVISPPGFPFLLVPLLKYFGLNFVLLKLPNLIFWVFYVLSLRFIMRKRLKEGLALLGSLFILTSPSFFTFKQNILTDIPFLSFVTGAIYLFEKYAETKKGGGSHKAIIYLIAAAFLMFYSILIRFSGVLLLIAACIYFSTFKKDKRALMAITGFGITSLGIQYFLGVSFSLHLQEKNIPLLEGVVRAYGYLSEIFIYLFSFFFPIWTTVGKAGNRTLWNIIPQISLLLIACIIAVFCYRVIRKKTTFTELFTIIYLFGLIIWGISGGGRYILPLAGPVLIFCIELFHNSFEYFKKKMPRNTYFQPDKIIGFMLFCLILHNIYAIAVNFHFDDNDVNKREVRELVRWIRYNVKNEEHIMFPKHRALGLLTEKKVATYFVASTKERNLAERIQRHNIRYLIIPNKDRPIIMRIAESNNIIIRPAWANDAFRIFMVIS
ncbi:MAG: glycosyltransferase family 39 protein [Candidatus Omnitrophica bacterium]|nr:glycosyltransferase family 39 protein [Candidatus Omnitrophota bacterium]